MDGFPDEKLLLTGAAFHIGGCDKTGHPLVIFPTQYHSAISSMADCDLITLLSYFKLIVPLQQKLNGFTYLVNLQKSSQQIITKIITSLNSLQVTTAPDSPGLVHCLYAIKPKSAKNVSVLEKLTGIKPSKKNPIQPLYQVHILKDFASLHRSVDKLALTEEFGGHQQIAIPAWAQFRTQVDKLSVDIGRCGGLLDESKDQMHILCELEIPAVIENTETLLDFINNKYSSVMGNLNLEHVIDKCSSVLEELNATKGQVKYAQGDLLRDLVKHFRTSQRELTEAREYLQIEWRKAQARVIQASQLRGHQKNANKISKWIDRNGNAKLSELTQPITSLTQVTSLKQRMQELTTNFQELEKEAEYIQTDIEYMALQDLSEFADSFKSIERMKTELGEFSSNLRKLDEKFNTASALFANVTKCYNWHCDFLNSLPQTTDESEFIIHHKQCIEKLKDTSPPKEWLEYIESKLTLIEDSLYCDNTLMLIQRIHGLLNMTSEHKPGLSLSQVNEWKASLADGFDKLRNSQPPIQQSVRPATTTHKPKSKKPLKGSVFGAPKLRVAIPDSSTDDVEGTDAFPARNKRPPRNRKTPTKSADRNGDMASKDDSQEVYIDLTDGVKVPQLPESLSHVDLSKFLENEPDSGGAALASSTPVEDALSIASANNGQSYAIVNDVKKKKKKSRRRRKTDDDTDDSCPHPTDYLYSNIAGGTPASNSGCSTPLSYAVPQNYKLPYNPVTQKERLERIYRSKSPTPEQKLDMMASLIDEGDESCFHVKLKESSNYVNTGKPTPAMDIEDGAKIGRLTPANISRELSADVTYPEHIYHWLKKQNDESFSSRENLTDVRDETDSLKNCIKRAEKILKEGLPTFPLPLSRVDMRSKSGDSGITELTNRETFTLFSNGQQQRYASRESGLDSDITGYTYRGSEPPSHRPDTYTREVPPLWLKKPCRTANQHSSPKHHAANKSLTSQDQTAKGLHKTSNQNSSIQQPSSNQSSSLQHPSSNHHSYSSRSASRSASNHSLSLHS